MMFAGYLSLLSQGELSNLRNLLGKFGRMEKNYDNIIARKGSGKERNE